MERATTLSEEIRNIISRINELSFEIRKNRYLLLEIERRGNASNSKIKKMANDISAKVSALNALRNQLAASDEYRACCEAEHQLRMERLINGHKEIIILLDQFNINA